MPAKAPAARGTAQGEAQHLCELAAAEAYNDVAHVDIRAAPSLVMELPELLSTIVPGAISIRQRYCVSLGVPCIMICNGS
mmetsp:Transcript_66025/g.173700  ORF Transcript_66025/g.173700 Transcript_66025/m.173700 type:complete len:80 (-) Transcript_66025:30-269(-)